MAETDISHEFGGEPGFSCSVFGPECSHMLLKMNTSNVSDKIQIFRP